VDGEQEWRKRKRKGSSDPWVGHERAKEGKIRKGKDTEKYEGKHQSRFPKTEQVYISPRGAIKRNPMYRNY
jgi:hypothetical protein